MDTDENKKVNNRICRAGKNTAFLLKEETHNIIGCAFEVLNELATG